MKFYSLNKKAPAVDFREATIQGQAPDKGLYFPEQIPQWDQKWIADWENLSREEIAYRVIEPFVAGTIPEEVLQKIVSDTVNFPSPLVKVKNVFSLELFHGPTLAFKDTGARFMSRCLGYFFREEKRKVTVLVATSGDTGGAVAHGFYGVEGVEVVILYPSGKVSPVQEKQLTTLGKNITALEVSGSFDDCQAMVKQAFLDEDIRAKRLLTSANSINVARWLPQQFYYCFAWQQWPDKNNPPVISVPSGNFGNICAGLLAQQSGLPVSHFIAACNINDPVTRYLGSGVYQTGPASPTYSNAMDVGDPSNFVRILELFEQEFPKLKNSLSSYSYSDDETLAAIRTVYQQTGYLADPHGAVGYLALSRYIAEHPDVKGLFLETAHPVKFPEAVEKASGQPVEMPEELNGLMQREKESTLIRPFYEDLKQFLLHG